MNYEKLLNKYTTNETFTFSPGEELKHKCNAPKDGAGVYLIFEINGTEEKLIYIGSSGQKNKQGKLKIRKDGLYGRLVKGYHPQKSGWAKRIKISKAFPEQMVNSGSDKIKIKWWVTYNADHSDFPMDVKKELKGIFR